MDHEKFDSDKVDEIMLPGFRFHPTDEELVGFYLKRKVQQRLLPIELIKQLDIYKYDPWDLPKLAAIGEKEWYFYCPRDRKYRNSVRPNRVTGGGFWKATGTDRPIYSAEGSKCIGLKKSLVFYRGRAAKGIKTDWMMHEFRLPSFSNSSTPPKLPLDKNQTPNDSWAICRIFKKTNSMVQKALSHSNWVSSLPETIHNIPAMNYTKLSSSAENISCVTTQAGSAFQFCNISNDLHQSSSTSNFFTLDTASQSYKSNNPISSHPAGFMFSSFDMLGPNTKCPEDVPSMILNLSPSILGESTTSKINQSTAHNFDGIQEHSIHGSSMTLTQEMHQGISLGVGEEACLQKNQQIASSVNNQLEELVSSSIFELPFAPACNNLTHETWKNCFSWDSTPCPSELSSTSYSTNKSYT